MKRCPYCAEEIQDAAVKCRYCLSDLPAAAPPEPLAVPAPVPAPAAARPAPSREPAPAKSRLSLSQIIMVVCCALAAGYTLLRIVYVTEKRRAQANASGLIRALPYDEPAPRAPAPVRDPSLSHPLLAEALPAARAATSDDSRASQEHYLSGITYFARGEYLQARQEWQEALRLDPNNVDAKAALDRLRAVLGESR